MQARALVQVQVQVQVQERALVRVLAQEQELVLVQVQVPEPVLAQEPPREQAWLRGQAWPLLQQELGRISWRTEWRGQE